jgi:hypothetical protein
VVAERKNCTHATDAPKEPKEMRVAPHPQQKRRALWLFDCCCLTINRSRVALGFDIPLATRRMSETLYARVPDAQ